jgi:beta-1,4-N-acetylglucosaminyltransferase
VFKPKVCLVSSSGGHYTQLKILFSKLHNSCDVFVVTEKTEILNLSNQVTYFLHQFNRKKIVGIFILIRNILKSLKILIKEKPDFIISTGAGSTVPLMLLGKILGAKLIYIESFAKRKSPTLTGKILYRFADRFYVQWPEMLEVFPEAEYKGAIY